MCCGAAKHSELVLIISCMPFHTTIKQTDASDTLKTADPNELAYMLVEKPANGSCVLKI